MYLLYITILMIETCKVVLDSLFVMLCRTDKGKEVVFWWGKFLNGNRKLYFNGVISSSLADFSKWFKIVSLGTSRKNLTKLWIQIQKKENQLPDFLRICQIFVKEHAHWGEKIQRVNFRHTRKVKFNATFFPAKGAQNESVNVSMLETGL